MVSVNPALPALSPDHVSLYYTRDALLDNLPVIIFYGPSNTANSTHNSSRIQAHVYSLAGFQSFARLTVAPTLPVYAAVHHLPTEKQGDEVYRGLAVSLLSYFAGISKATKESLRDNVARRRPNRLAPAMFDEMHAGDLAARMVKIEDSNQSITYMVSALSTQMLSSIDMDIVLPPGTIERVMSGEGLDQAPSIGDDGLPLYQYGAFTSLINALGSATFLPTSKLKRAPSKPTAHSKNKSMTKDQKVSLRREMCEMLDTEKRYIDKVHEIVHNIAKGFGSNINNSAASEIVDKLFPESLERILALNAAFYDEMERVLEGTEDEAIKDIEAVSEQPSLAFKSRKRDATGTTAFAKTLLQWFPKFTTPYQDYMRSSTNLSNTLNEAMQADLPVSVKVQEIGEQRLRSALIEPVQRLPRYNLLLENMINLLPASHPALAPLLKAKDVITEICALDSASSMDSSRTMACLRSLVESWPAHLSPRGRLITAADVEELETPYMEVAGGQAGLLLLFPDTCILLRKHGLSALSARGLVAEVERPTIRMKALGDEISKTLTFSTEFSLSTLRFSHSQNGRLLWLSCSNVPQNGSSAQYSTTTKVVALSSSYEGKAARLSEEIVKSTIEGRFPESWRESDKWTLRTIDSPSQGLGVLAAIFENDHADQSAALPLSSHLRVVIGGTGNTKSILTANTAIHFACCVSHIGNDMYRLDCRSIDGNASTDTTSTEGLPHMLLKNVERMLRAQYQAQSCGLANVSIDLHRNILGKIPIRELEDDSRSRGFRPLSPVKLISNFLNSSLSNQPTTPSRQREDIQVMRDVPRMLPPLPSDTPTEGPAHTISPGDKVATIQANVTEPSESFASLEDTFATYVVALRSRSGNIVGKVLRARAGADELAVNELYNILIEDPSRIQAAAEVPVDVLFVAFEKFLKTAWRDRMGPLLASGILGAMQAAFDTARPVEFSQQFRSALEEMTPQNKRAFSALIRLLSELLDASGNDGDRGALMASFAEALVVDGISHDYISLLDRLVEDFEILFDGGPAPVTKVNSDSLKSNRSVNTGSLSSNASSLRKKFGFGSLSRENSKSESESKVASVWRTLSKNSKSPGEPHSQPSSLSKGSLLRSRSTDTDVRMLPPLRPASRDRPVTSSGTAGEQTEPRPGSSHRSMAVLSTIGENTPTKPSVLTKKKRRSSLSDLQSLRDSPAASTWTPSSPSQLRTPTNFQRRSGLATNSPREQNTTLQTSGAKPDGPPKLPLGRFGSPERFGTPQQKANTPQRFGSLQQKASSPQATRIASPRRAINRPDETTIASPGPVKRKTSHTGIPTPKGLSEPSWPPNGTTPPKKTLKPPQKLRMQSPQKLRQRLSNEQKAHENSSTALQAELTAIGEELAALKRAPSTPSHIAPIKPLNITKASPVTTSTAKTTLVTTIDDLSARLTALTNTLSTHTSTASARLSSLSTESSGLSTQLDAANRKIKKLDGLYQEANAENEALYERFNDELGKILARVKAGEGVKVLKDRVGGLENEVASLRAENRKLKREVIDKDGVEGS